MSLKGAAGPPRKPVAREWAWAIDDYLHTLAEDVEAAVSVVAI